MLKHPRLDGGHYVPPEEKAIRWISAGARSMSLKRESIERLIVALDLVVDVIYQ